MFLPLFLVSFSIIATTNTGVASTKIHQDILSIFDFLENQQVKHTHDQNYFEGEWPSYMFNQKKPPLGLLGGRWYSSPDSNCFTPGKIIHILSRAYLDFGYKDERIPLMAKKTLKALSGCYSMEKSTFNFWHLIETKENVIERISKRPKLFEKRKDQFFPRRNPNHYNLEYLYLMNFANIHDDADDTSMGLKVLYDIQEMGLKETIIDEGFKIPERVGPIFNYRDENRVTRHYFDIFNQRPKETGAFLTWLGDEKSKIGFENFKPNKYGPNIPMGLNDVDCVVNANVLGVLSTYGEYETAEGVKQSCEYLKKVVVDEKQLKVCATYYPNYYNVYYAVSDAVQKGVQCLESIQDTVLNKIIMEQKDNGSFDPYHDNRDSIHGTLFASIALLNFSKNSENLEIIKSTLSRAYNYLESQKDEKGLLKEGIFFSGGAFVRNNIYWKSQSYTMALYLEFLLKYQEFLTESS